MSLVAIILVAVIGLLVGGAASGLLANRRGDWPPLRRTLVAALVAPVLMLVAVGAGILVTGVRQGGAGMEDLAGAAMLTIGLTGAAVAFAAGLAAAWWVSLEG